MSKKLIHAYPVNHFANQVKVDKLLSLIAEWSEGIRELVCSGDIAFTAFRANPAKILLSVSVE